MESKYLLVGVTVHHISTLDTESDVNGRFISLNKKKELKTTDEVAEIQGKQHQHFL